MTDSKTIVFSPEATFGPSMNCVGIAQVLRERGHNPVFVADSAFENVVQEIRLSRTLSRHVRADGLGLR